MVWAWLSPPFKFSDPGGSSNAEPPDGADLGELCRQIGERLFQGAGVNAAGSDGLPYGFPVAAGQNVHAGGGHFGLDGILNGVDRGGQFIGHAAQFPQLVNLGIKIFVDHGMYLLKIWGTPAAGVIEASALCAATSAYRPALIRDLGRYCLQTIAGV